MINRNKEKDDLEKYIDEPTPMRQYSPAELRDFHEKVQKYYFNHTISGGEVIRVLNRKRLLIAFGSTGPKGGIILHGVTRNDRTGSISGYSRPTRMEAFENLWKQYAEWKVKEGIDKGSSVFKKNLQLEKLAESMGVEYPEEIEVEYPEE